MNPSPTQPDRTLLHTRQVVCRGYRRSDGLYDIEGQMQDISAEGTEMPFVIVEAGGRIHDMLIVMTVDAGQVIHRVEARTSVGPTPFCAQINAAYARLAGIRIGAGFRAAVKARVGGVAGCTHLTELLGPLATTALQTLMADARARRPWRVVKEDTTPLAKPWIVDTCHAYRTGGDGVDVIWPAHRRIVQNDPDKAQG